jgi:hypothetical protein
MKIIFFSLGIQQIIQNIVKSKDVILKSTLDMNGDGKVDIADFSIFLRASRN